LIGESVPKLGLLEESTIPRVHQCVIKFNLFIDSSVTIIAMEYGVGLKGI